MQRVSSAFLPAVTPKDQLGYPSMAELIPPGTLGEVTIRHITITPERVRNEQFRDVINQRWTSRGLVPGTYCVMEVSGEIVMSDTWLERWTNLDIVNHAHGHVLIAGLGIGLVLTRILPDPKVSTVTVIEKSPDAIALIGPHYQDSKFTIVCADIHTWTPPSKSTRYNVIYFDIWNHISADNYPETKLLHARYRKYLDKEDPDRWMDSWLRDYVKSEHHKERRSPW